MNPPELHVKYKRTGESYEGALQSRGRTLSVLHRVSFQELIRKISELLREEHYDHVVLERTDREGLLPYKLDDVTVRLIRDDPVLAIDALSVGRSPSSVVSHRRARPVVAAGLRAGIDALADSLGDNVYVRHMSGNRVECPGCGFWSDAQSSFECHRRCRIHLQVTLYERWAAVPVMPLLQTGLPHFYLPRPWNPTPPWVSSGQLQRLFDEFTKERKRACTNLPDPTV